MSAERTPRLALALVLLSAALGACESSENGAAPDAGVDTSAAVDVASDPGSADDTGGPGADGEAGAQDAPVAPEVTTLSGCEAGGVAALALELHGEPGGLALGQGVAVWAAGGDLWLLELSTCELRQVAPRAAQQRDPALSGATLVWSDDRNGDLDLYAMDLASPGQERVLVEAPGDQLGAAIDGSRVAWLDRRKAPHLPIDTDVWAVDLATPGAEPEAVTDDAVEQAWLDLSGSRVVWTDFGNDPEGRYIPDPIDPNTNNGDIVGVDLDTGAGFEVSTDPSKQIRPSIEGELVAWLDWRGISPEPKFQRLNVYVMRLGEGVETAIEETSWEAPQLIIRPVIVDSHIAWPVAGALKVAAPQGATGWTVSEVPGVAIERLAVAPGRLGWLTRDEGALSLSVYPLDALPTGP